MNPSHLQQTAIMYRILWLWGVGGGGGVRQRRAVYTRSLALSFSSQHESRSEDSVKVHGVSGTAYTWTVREYKVQACMTWDVRRGMTAGYFHGTLAYVIYIYGIYFYGFYFHGTYFYKANKI